jgi:hypothetical protein
MRDARRETIRNRIRQAFYVDAALTIYAAVVSILDTPRYVALHTSQVVTGTALELIRWGGIALIPLVTLECLALWKRRDDLLCWVLASFLAGDVVQLIAYARHFSDPSTEPATQALVFSVAVVAALAVLRVIWLFLYRAALTGSGLRERSARTAPWTFPPDRET